MNQKYLTKKIHTGIYNILLRKTINLEEFLKNNVNWYFRLYPDHYLSQNNYINR